MNRLPADRLLLADKAEISCAYHLTSGVLPSSTLPVSESSKHLRVERLIPR
jgi:hypothetical protein